MPNPKPLALAVICVLPYLGHLTTCSSCFLGFLGDDIFATSAFSFHILIILMLLSIVPQESESSAYDNQLPAGMYKVDNFIGEKYVAIKQGQYLKLDNATLKLK